ncbi:hypothetical protein [Micromonospora sp. NPDC049679]
MLSTGPGDEVGDIKLRFAAAPHEQGWFAVRRRAVDRAADLS